MVTLWKRDLEPDAWADLMVDLGLPLSTFRISIDPTAIVDYQAEITREEKHEKMDINY